MMYKKGQPSRLCKREQRDSPKVPTMWYCTVAVAMFLKDLAILSENHADRRIVRIRHHEVTAVSWWA